MEDKSLTDEKKDVCNKLVGTWYLENNQQIIEFHLLDRLFHESKLIIKNTNEPIIETLYGVGVFPHTEIKINAEFYIDIGFRKDKKYLIKTLTKDKLIFQVHNHYEPTNMYCTYVRKIDVGFADDILRELYCI